MKEMRSMKKKKRKKGKREEAGEGDSVVLEVESEKDSKRGREGGGGRKMVR